jgi:hypothetical protein
VPHRLLHLTASNPSSSAHRPEDKGARSRVCDLTPMAAEDLHYASRNELEPTG